MASRQRSISGKARTISAVTRDSLNKNVIPAFQELHATLDAYPDTLDKINRIEKNRLNMLNDMDGGGRGGGILAGVAERSGGGGGMDGAIKGLGFVVDNLASAITTTALGTAGVNMQERKANAARIGGADMYDKARYMLEDAADVGQTSMENVEPIVNTLIELRGVTEANIGELAGDFYNMAQAGMAAGDQIAVLYDRMQRLGGVKGEEFTILADKVKWFAEESTLSSQEMFQVLEKAAEGMTMFSGEAAKAYRETSLAAAAAAANMGVSADFGQTTADKLMNSTELMSRAQGLVNASGQNINIQALVSGGKIGELQDALFKAIISKYGELDLTNPNARQMYNTIAGGILSPEEFMNMQSARKSGGITGETSAVKMKEKSDILAPGAVSETVEKARGTFMGAMEKLGGLGSRLLARPGEKMMDTFGGGANWVAGKGDEGVDRVIAFDDAHEEKLSRGVAVVGGISTANLGMNTLGAGANALGMGRTAGVLSGEGALGTVARGAAYVGVGGAIWQNSKPGEDPVRAIDLVSGNEEQLMAMQKMFNEAGVSANAVRLVARGETEKLRKALEEAAAKLKVNGQLDSMPDFSAIEEITKTIKDINAEDISSYDTRSPFQKLWDKASSALSPKANAGRMADAWGARYEGKDNLQVAGDLVHEGFKTIPGSGLFEGGYKAGAKTGEAIGHGLGFTANKMDEWMNPISLAKKFFSTGNSERTFSDELQIQDAFTKTQRDFDKKFDGEKFDPSNLEHQKFMNERMQKNLPKDLLESMQGGDSRGVVADVTKVLEEFRVANGDGGKANPELTAQTTLQTQMAQYLKQIAEASTRPQAPPRQLIVTENTAGVAAEDTFREQARR
jgi:hypothetical protein